MPENQLPCQTVAIISDNGPPYAFIIEHFDTEYTEIENIAADQTAWNNAYILRKLIFADFAVLGQKREIKFFFLLPEWSNCEN